MLTFFYFWVMKTICIILLTVFSAAAFSQTVETFYFNKEYIQVRTKDSAAYYARVTQNIVEKVIATGKKGKEIKQEELEVLHYEIYTIQNKLVYYSDITSAPLENDSIVVHYFNNSVREINYFNSNHALKLQKNFTINGKLDNITTYVNGKQDSIYNYDANEKLSYVQVFEGFAPKTVYFVAADGTKKYVNSQEDSSVINNEQKIFTLVEKMPSYPGGEQNMYEYLKNNINYPREARNNNISGKVYVGFIVNKNGAIENVFLKRGAHPLLDFESMKVISKMPLWEPGMQQGEVINSAYTLPVQFKLSN